MIASVVLDQTVSFKQGSLRTQTPLPVLIPGKLLSAPEKVGPCVLWPAADITAQCAPFIAKPKVCAALR